MLFRSWHNAGTVDITVNGETKTVENTAVFTIENVRLWDGVFDPYLYTASASADPPPTKPEISGWLSMGKINDFQQVEIDRLVPYINNAKQHGEEQILKIAASIREFGFLSPCVIDADYNIIAGHGRVAAARRLGLATVPCVFAEGLTEAQRKAYILADNRLGELAEWDTDLVTSELEALQELDFDIDLTGFELPETVEEKEIVEDEAPEDVETRCKLGDLWELGNHRLICGDSTDVTVIDRLMDGAKGDMILSDPPYGMNLDTDFSTIKGSLKSLGRKNHTEGNRYERVIGDNEDFSPALIDTFFINFGYTKEMFLFGADYFAELLTDKNKGSWLVWDKRKESQADAIGSEFELIWSKNKHKRRMLRHDWFGFLSSENGADARNRVHPTQKPVTLLVDIMRQWGKDEDIVVDIFGGSGSTLIACEQLNRKCYMSELDPHYCDVIIQRWENFTGEKAVLLNG